jgi:hypothetical protein
MNIRHRVAAAVATVGLAATGLALAAPAAQAAPLPQAAPKACKIEGISPSTVVVGLSPRKVKFTPITSGCKVTSWSIATDNFVVTNKDPYATYKAPAMFNTRTKASPEPAEKGHKITVMGQLAAAVWKQNGYAGYAGQPLKVQFKAKGGKYKTVKTVTSSEYGYTQTTVTAKKSGTWRMTFAGSSTATSAAARGDYVKVIK